MTTVAAAPAAAAAPAHPPRPSGPGLDPPTRRAPRPIRRQRLRVTLSTVTVIGIQVGPQRQPASSKFKLTLAADWPAVSQHGTRKADSECLRLITASDRAREATRMIRRPTRASLSPSRSVTVTAVTGSVTVTAVTGEGDANLNQTSRSLSELKFNLKSETVCRNTGRGTMPRCRAGTARNSMLNPGPLPVSRSRSPGLHPG